MILIVGINKYKKLPKSCKIIEINNNNLNLNKNKYFKLLEKIKNELNEKINKLKDLISQNQPAYYVSTSDFSYNNGKKLSKTWADFIRLDTEHSSFNFDGINNFMKGLIDGGPTKSGHLSPTV